MKKEKISKGDFREEFYPGVGRLMKLLGKKQKIKKRGNYIDGKKDGTHENFFENGQLERKEDYKNGTLILSQTFNQGGIPLNNLTYSKGKKTGMEVVEFHSNGKAKEARNYKDGKELSFKTSFTYPESPGFTLIERVERGAYKDGKKEGLWEIFDEAWDSEITYDVENYKAGFLHGVQKSYWHWGDDKLYLKYNYKYGEMQSYEEYNESGQLIEKREYDRGIQRLAVIEYFDGEGNMIKTEKIDLDEDGNLTAQPEHPFKAS